MIGNESPDNWKVSTNAEIRDAMKELYNGWFVYWRDRAATADAADWKECIAEADEILEHTRGSVAGKIAVALIYELEARWQEANVKGRKTAG